MGAGPLKEQTGSAAARDLEMLVEAVAEGLLTVAVGEVRVGMEGVGGS